MSKHILAHGAVAAVRLWGAMWEKADRVEIFLPEIDNEKVKRKLFDQVEDCKNKYGVRVVVAFEGRGGGAQDLAEPSEPCQPMNQSLRKNLI